MAAASEIKAMLLQPLDRLFQGRHPDLDLLAQELEADCTDMDLDDLERACNRLKRSRSSFPSLRDLFAAIKTQRAAKQTAKHISPLAGAYQTITELDDEREVLVKLSRWDRSISDRAIKHRYVPALIHYAATHDEPPTEQDLKTMAVKSRETDKLAMITPYAKLRDAMHEAATRRLKEALG